MAARWAGGGAEREGPDRLSPSPTPKLEGRTDVARAAPTGTLRVPEKPNESPGDRFLKQVIDHFGEPERLPDFSPHEQGRWLAIKNMAPLYSTRFEAMQDLLSASQQARLMECISVMIGDGSLPFNYLMEPLEEPALIWEPVAQESVANMVLFGLSKNEGGARAVFRDRFLQHWSVDRTLSPTLDFSRRSTLNPEMKAISPDAKAYLRTIEKQYAEQVLDRILHGPIVDAYLDARATKLANHDYIALPFNAVFLLSTCGKGARRRALDGIGAKDGWTVHVEITPGDSAAYDAAFNEIDGIVISRDEQMKAYIRSLP